MLWIKRKLGGALLVLLGLYLLWTFGLNPDQRQALGTNMATGICIVGIVAIIAGVHYAKPKKSK